MSLILGIAGIVSVLLAPFVANFPALIGLIISIVGIVYGVKARNEIPKGAKGRGMATGGFICSIFGVVFGSIAVLCSICLCTACIACGALGAANLDPSEWSEWAKYLEDYTDTLTIFFR